MTKLELVALLLLVLSSIPADTKAQASTAASAIPICTVTAEDVTVYAAVLNNFGKPDNAHRERVTPDLMVADTTVNPKDYSGQGGLGSRLKLKAELQTIANFDVRVRSACSLGSRWGKRGSVQIVSAEYLADFFKHRSDGWQDFYNKYPKSGGYFDFSTVGYNSAHSEALAYVGYHCGWMCGTGELLLLEKQAGKWHVENRTVAWVS